jgi:hypothetical protein
MYQHTMCREAAAGEDADGGLPGRALSLGVSQSICPFA